MIRRAPSIVAGGPKPRWRVRWLPVATVLIGSLLTAWPAIVSAPLLPPLGLLMLLSWRLLRSDIWPLWIGIPLGLWDDLLSGQPIGTAVFSWSAIMITIDLMDRRVVWRDYWIDWGLGSLAIAFALIVAGLLAGAGSLGEVLMLIWPQWMWSSFLLPLAMHWVGLLDRWRLRR